MSETTRIQTFSDRALESPGMRRRIAVHERDSGPPVLVIELLRDDVRVGTRFINADEIEPLERAIALTRSSELGPVLRATGEIKLRSGARFAFGAVRDRRDPSVHIWIISADGDVRGRKTVIHGAELASLDAACEAVREATREPRTEGDPT